MRERKETLSLLSFLPRHERPLLAGKNSVKNYYIATGCKENHFYSLLLGQAETRIYLPICHFN